MNQMRKTMEMDREIRRRNEQTGGVTTREGKHATADEFIEDLKEKRSRRQVLTHTHTTRTHKHTRTHRHIHTHTHRNKKPLSPLRRQRANSKGPKGW